MFFDDYEQDFINKRCVRDGLRKDFNRFKMYCEQRMQRELNINHNSQSYFSLDIKQKKGGYKEEKDFVNSAIGLSEIVIKKFKIIPEEIIGEICVYLSSGSKNEFSRRKKSEKIYAKMSRNFQIKNRLKKCSTIDSYEDKYTNELQTKEKRDHIKNYFGFSIRNYCGLL